MVVFGEYPRRGQFSLRPFRPLDGSSDDLSRGSRAREVGEYGGEDVILGLELQQDSVSVLLRISLLHEGQLGSAGSIIYEFPGCMCCIHSGEHSIHMHCVVYAMCVIVEQHVCTNSAAALS